jgi:hypothetical protein
MIRFVENQFLGIYLEIRYIHIHYPFSLQGYKEKYKYKRNNKKQRDKTFFESDVGIF